MSSEKIKIIKKSSKEYPKILREIVNAPKQLYVRGELPKNHEMNFAIVGTRAASEYGKTLAFKIAKELAELGFNIVSGLALGIDTQAHLGALAGGGKTIAVLGSGTLDASIFPKENLALVKKIVDSGGAVISEYEPQAKSEIWYFPERNRIVSGLSRGALVVEAPEKSGALITARLALEQNREVFAIPGSVFSKNSIGANNLIKSGAKMVTSVDDILEEFNLIGLKSKKGENKRENMNPEEKLIFSIIEKEPVHIDKICEIAKMPAGRVMSIVSILEIQGIIKNIGGKFAKI
ncbi:MAG: protecting protein DprA protein [Candidatus Giovannonibacteria bacterium GW2011_GWA2_45_21]|uniref:Protecting protein DprA protein n=1 Tax=Candidatus Giovannonibacteria bacterium GW2011_GWA2_45_21 TaxID=1618649 RepID=A0A0G1M7G8_9BACT|nr:MAG: protecting protein DprA protein [Candidatus Giovannonibacteria bacterium GW2011_GWA2_45_21]